MYAVIPTWVAAGGRGEVIIDTSSPLFPANALACLLSPEAV